MSCDRPLDGATAAKKLNSERFDLVVVDCDNLPAAKLIFDVCRRSHGGATVPVAIVDGRAGLPTAFRLGADLILTKPVAMDQARATIRTAVGRTKKEKPAQEAKPEIAGVGVEKQQESTVPKAMAAAAGAGSGNSARTMVAATPVLAPASVTNSEAPSTAPVSQTTAPVISASSNASAAATAAMAIEPAVTSAAPTSSTEKKAVSEASKKDSSSRRQISEDPVMAALEKNEPPQQSPRFSAFEEPRPERSRALLLATLLLAVAGGAGYSAWMYQPGFSKFIELRIEQAKTLLGFGGKGSAVAIRPAPPAIGVKAAVQQAAPSPVASSALKQSSPGPAPSASNNISPSTTSGGSAASVTTPASTTGATPAPEPEKKVETPGTTATEFPEAKNAVILSSKGAENRLLHRVAPAVPAGARGQSAEATVVLKALIDENGAVKALQTVEGDAALTGAAMKAVKQWRYKPYTRDGRALPFQTIVLVDFQ